MCVPSKYSQHNQLQSKLGDPSRQDRLVQDRSDTCWIAATSRPSHHIAYSVPRYRLEPQTLHSVNAVEVDAEIASSGNASGFNYPQSCR